MEVFTGTATEYHLPYGITQCSLLHTTKTTISVQMFIYFTKCPITVHFGLTFV